MLQSIARSVRVHAPTASTSCTRSFHVTRTTPFLFNRPRASTTNTLLQDLEQATRNDRLDLILKLYPSLIKQHSVHPLPPTRQTHDQLQSLMRFLSSTPKFTLLLRIFNDLPQLGYTQEHRDHHLLLAGMSKAGKLDKALKWIESMSSSHGIQPRTSDWNLMLNGHRRLGDLEGMRHTMNRMKAANAEPNVVSFNSLLSALFSLGQVDQVRHTIKEMQQLGVRHDLYTETTLLDGFLEAGEMGSAREVQRRLEALVGGQEALDTPALNALLKFEAVVRGYASALELARRFREEGRRLNGRTLSTLAVEGSKKVQSAEEGVRLLEELERVTGQGADRRAWSIVLQGLLASPSGGGLPAALTLHQEARDRSIQPDSTMIQPLLSSLLLPTPTPTSLAVAKELYEDLSQASRAFTTSPDHSIYTTLLRACADPSAPDLDFARQLVADMRERGVRLEGASVPWYIIALMRAAGSWEGAFGAYDTIRALDVTALDQHGYNTVLSAFTSLHFPLEPPPLAMIHELLSDMRHSTHAPPTSHTYSLLLTYLSRLPHASSSSIAHLHSLLKLDINLDPDTALFNSLMGAYARVGAYNAAHRIWDTMRANGRGNKDARVDQRSLSVLVDCCGFEGGEAGAKWLERVWKEVGEGRVEGLTQGEGGRNRNNWEAYIEALCRLGRFDAAERAVFEEMKTELGEPEPGVGTVQVLLKMSRRGGDHVWARVRERVRCELPELWEEVKGVAPFGEQGDLQVPKEERGEGSIESVP